MCHPNDSPVAKAIILANHRAARAAAEAAGVELPRPSGPRLPRNNAPTKTVSSTGRPLFKGTVPKRCEKLRGKLDGIVKARGLDKTAAGTQAHDAFVETLMCWGKLAGEPCADGLLDLIKCRKSVCGSQFYARTGKRHCNTEMMTLEGCLGGVLGAPAPAPNPDLGNADSGADKVGWKEAEKRTALGLATPYLTDEWEKDAKSSANVGEEHTRWLDPAVRREVAAERKAEGKA